MADSHSLSSANPHAACDFVRMALADVGLDPERVMCRDDPAGGDPICAVGFGLGTEGRTQEEVDRLCDKAIELAGWSLDG